MAQERVTDEALKAEAEFWHRTYKGEWDAGRYWEFDVRKRQPDSAPSRFKGFESPLTKYRNYVFGHAMSKQGMRVLELGCGGGSQTLEFARAGCNVTGIDLCEENLELARKRAVEQLAEWDSLAPEVYGIPLDRDKYREPEYVAMDLNNPDLSHPAFRAESVDLVFCGGTLHHIVEADRLMQAVHRALAPGGSFMALESRGHDPKIQALLNLIRRVRQVDFPESPFEGQQHDYHGLVARYFEIKVEKYFSIFAFRMLPHLDRIRKRFADSVLAYMGSWTLYNTAKALDWLLIGTRICRSEVVFVHGVKPDKR